MDEETKMIFIVFIDSIVLLFYFPIRFVSEEFNRDKGSEVEKPSDSAIHLSFSAQQ